MAESDTKLIGIDELRAEYEFTGLRLDGGNRTLMYTHRETGRCVGVDPVAVMPLVNAVYSLTTTLGEILNSRECGHRQEEICNALVEGSLSMKLAGWKSEQLSEATP